ncbi:MULTISPECIES: phosphodiesterase [unclassified Thioalkalivibrio]|uniref:phosphodiesterase n=1 Tax=unclassified Thioalkalivibrio TaxID=2621013 RepID=UPI0003801FE9|nr:MULTISPECIES: phosphodiesterase [unclassified Thioalkalivibrio]
MHTMSTTQRLIQISDTHLGRVPGPIRAGYPDSDTQLERILGALPREPAADALLLSGDLAEDPEPATYARLARLLGSRREPMLALAGNHDDCQTLRTALEPETCQVHGERMLGPWKLIGLDSSTPGEAAGRLDASECERLEKSLSADPDRPTVVALHHPPVAIGSAWMDRLGLLDPDALFAVLDRHPQVRACLFGHIHQDFRARRGAIEFLGSPSTCVQFTPGSEEFAVDAALDAGYRILDLHPDGRFDTQVVRVPGTRIAMEPSA